jgi:hypothetical protein
MWNTTIKGNMEKFHVFFYIFNLYPLIFLYRFGTAFFSVYLLLEPPLQIIDGLVWLGYMLHISDDISASRTRINLSIAALIALRGASWVRYG